MVTGLPITKSATGVSVVICCHNSAARLPETLRHLAAQRVSRDIPWEVIVVDNASTDETSGVAVAQWPAAAPAPLRVVAERRIGLVFARERGFAEARYDFVSFVDDDNWVCPEWIEAVFGLMTENPEVGICGSLNSAVCEVAPPAWFEGFKTIFAITPSDAATGDLTQSEGVVLGAGMTVRRQAWEGLRVHGFRQIVTGRQGKILTAGDDSEICLAVRLAGWRIWRDSRLRLEHFLPAARLKWAYVRRLFRGYGVSSVRLDGYALLAGESEATWKRPLRLTWQWHMLAALFSLAKRPAKTICALLSPLEGDPAVPSLEIQMGRVLGFLHDHDSYRQHRAAIRQLKRSLHRKPPLAVAEPESAGSHCR